MSIGLSLNNINNNLSPGVILKIEIPKDPRCWRRYEVAVWLKQMEFLNQLPQIQLERFSMNGKALCLMSAEMFLDRVPDGGKLLFEEFRYRLARAMYEIELNS